MTRRQWQYTPIVLLVGLLAADWVPEDCPDCFHEGYRVDMSAVPLPVAPPPAVLFSGYRNGRCRDDLICTGAPDAWFGDLQGKLMNWWKSCGNLGREMVVFAGGHAPTILAPPEGSTELTPTLNDAAPLKIAAWVEEGDPNRKVDAAEQLDMAQQTFDQLGAGIQLEYVVGTYPSRLRLPAALTGFVDDATCDHAYVLQGSTAPELLAMQDPQKLNVYFVKEMHNPWSGMTCAGATNPPSPDSTRYMIFVSELRHAPSTVAHEIGHALGLILYASLPGGGVGSYPGDINELEMSPYLPTDNLMFSGVGTVGHITVGEIYRMHFDKRSWLWRGKFGGSGYPRECQASPEEGGICPPLAIHPTRGWP